MIIGFTIQDIRERHHRVAKAWATPVDDEADRAHIDRGVLLSEVDRRGAEIEKLREVLKIVRINGPDSNGLVWWSFSREGGVRVSFVLGHEERMLSQAFLEFEEIRRKALEGKP